MITIIKTPRPRQVVVIAERGRLIGFCAAARCRASKGDGDVINLKHGLADGSEMTQSAFNASRKLGHAGWSQLYPEAQIVRLSCSTDADPEQYAIQEARRRVINGR